MLLLLGVVVGFGSQLVSAEVTTITFDEKPTSSIGYDAHYMFAVQGLEVPSGQVVSTQDPTPHSATQLLEVQHGEFYNGGGLVLYLTRGATGVSFFGTASASLGDTIQGTAVAYNSAHQQISSDGPKPLVVGKVATPFSLSANNSIDPIYTVVFTDTLTRGPQSYESPEYLDDLTLDNSKPAPPPIADPLVAISSPTVGATYPTGPVPLLGSVAGDQLKGGLTVQVSTPPFDGVSGPPPTVFPVQLGPLSGVVQPFGASLPDSIGPHAVDVTARNVLGGEGDGHTSYEIVPSDVQFRHTNDAGNGAPGGLLWATEIKHGPQVGSAAVDCQLFGYSDEALGRTMDASGGWTIYSIQQPILDKWNAWRKSGQASAEKLCPLDAAHPVPGATRQDFLGGSIYKTTHSGGFPDLGGTFYVPAVIMNELRLAVVQPRPLATEPATLEEATGVPISDPTSSHAAHTWLFQRFRRDATGAESTVEIKGTPPKLWLERPGGNLFVAALGASKLSALDQPWLNGINPQVTVSESFPCSGDLGPCNLSGSPDAPPNYLGAATQNAADIDHHKTGNDFCAGRFPNWVFHNGVAPVEWARLRDSLSQVPANGHNGNAPGYQTYHQDSLNGFVTQTPGYSTSDWHVTHETFTGGFPYYASDYDLFVFPNEATSYVSSDPPVDVEWEATYAQYYFQYLGLPRAGEYAQIRGRWVEDCGERATEEIHPAGVVALSWLNPRDLGGLVTPVTSSSVSHTALWVNGYYLGEPTSIDLVPPARPAANAFLQISAPAAYASGRNVSVAPRIDGDWTSSVSLDISAPPLPLHDGTSADGMQPWNLGREYIGQWDIGWQVESAYSVTSLGPSWWP